MNTIPFLRLPFLVIQDVLSMMCPFELIHLAMASKRTKRVVKAILNTKLQNKYRTSVYIYDDYGIKIKYDRYRWYYMYTSKRTKVNYGRYISHAKYLHIYTYAKMENFKKLFECCQDIFGNISGIDLYMDDAENQLIIDFLASIQDSFEWCKVRSTTERGDEVKHLVDNLKITKNLRISAPLPEKLKLDLPENVEKILFVHAKFIKLEQVLASKSKTIELCSSKFTRRDISAILKSWVASESNLNLEHLRIGLDSILTDSIFRGIPNEMGRWFEIDHGFGRKTSVRTGLDITREDGKKARVVFWTGDDDTRLQIYTH